MPRRPLPNFGDSDLPGTENDEPADPSAAAPTQAGSQTDAQALSDPPSDPPDAFGATSTNNDSDAQLHSSTRHERFWLVFNSFAAGLGIIVAISSIIKFFQSGESVLIWLSFLGAVAVVALIGTFVYLITDKSFDEKLHKVLFHLLNRSADSASSATDSEPLDADTSSTAEEKLATVPLDLRRTIVTIGVISTLVIIVVTVLLSYQLLSDRPASDQTQTASPPESSEMSPPTCTTCVLGGKTFAQQANANSPKPTYRNPLALTGVGPKVQASQKIEVVCRFYDPNAQPSVQPGWWYLIASSPWNRQYYTVANSYLNGDPPEGPAVTTVDLEVPVC